MTHDQYTTEQQHLAKHLAGKLRETAASLRPAISDHALATALIGVGVEHAVRYMGQDEIASWLRGIADELDTTPHVDCAGEA